MKKIFAFASRCKGKLALSVLFAILGITGGMVPYFMAARISLAVIEGTYSMERMAGAVLTALLGYTAKVVFNALSTELSHQSAYSILQSIRSALTAKLSRVPLGYVTERPSGELKTVMVDTVEKLEAPFAHLIPEMTANLLVPVVLFIYLFSLDVRIALTSLVTIPLGMLFYIPLMKKYKKHYRKKVEAENEMNAQAVEYINGIEAIKAFNQSAASYESYAAAVKNNCSTISEFFTATLSEYTAVMTILPSTLLFVLPASLYFYSGGTLSLGHLVTEIILSFGLAGPLVQALKYTDNLASMGTVMEQISDIIKAEEMQRPAKEVPLKDCRIAFENVTFGYGEQEILHGVSFAANQGEMTAIVGPSGSGKSTAAKLLAGFWEAGGGKITLGGIDVRDLPLEQVNRTISYVSQDNFLFNLSIRENIRIGNPKASDREVEEAAKLASCHEFILSLKDGYDTAAGEGGSHLSGGERQRISIARAILKNSPVVLLDEATAYTDPENEAIIQQSISKLVQGKTMLVIAHRLSTISSADNIILMDQGCVKEQGTHKELLKGGGMYERMWKAHMGSKDRDLKKEEMAV